MSLSKETNRAQLKLSSEKIQEQCKHILDPEHTEKLENSDENDRVSCYCEEIIAHMVNSRQPDSILSTGRTAQRPDVSIAPGIEGNIHIECVAPNCGNALADLVQGTDYLNSIDQVCFQDPLKQREMERFLVRSSTESQLEQRLELSKIVRNQIKVKGNVFDENAQLTKWLNKKIIKESDHYIIAICLPKIKDTILPADLREIFLPPLYSIEVADHAFTITHAEAAPTIQAKHQTSRSFINQSTGTPLFLTKEYGHVSAVVIMRSMLPKFGLQETFGFSMIHNYFAINPLPYRLLPKYLDIFEELYCHKQSDHYVLRNVLPE